MYCSVRTYWVATVSLYYIYICYLYIVDIFCMFCDIRAGLWRWWMIRWSGNFCIILPHCHHIITFVCWCSMNRVLFSLHVNRLLIIEDKQTFRLKVIFTFLCSYPRRYPGLLLRNSSLLWCNLCYSPFHYSLSAGTAHGFCLFDFCQRRAISATCTLSATETSATDDSSMSRRKSFKKSLRESFRRLRRRRSMAGKTTKKDNNRLQEVKG